MHPHQATGTLFLRTSYPWVNFMFAFWKPKLTINGHEMSISWGDNHVPLPPGYYQISVHVPYLWRVGLATMTLDTRAAPAPPVYYAAPWFPYIGGAIGHQPVEGPGKVGYLIFLAVVLLVGLCACGLNVVAVFAA